MTHLLFAFLFGLIAGLPIGMLAAIHRLKYWLKLYGEAPAGEGGEGESGSE